MATEMASRGLVEWDTALALAKSNYRLWMRSSYRLEFYLRTLWTAPGSQCSICERAIGDPQAFRFGFQLACAGCFSELVESARGLFVSARLPRALPLLCACSEGAGYPDDVATMGLSSCRASYRS